MGRWGVAWVYMSTSLPPELTTVTPVSKYLALALFIILPFVGFYLGAVFGVYSQSLVEPVAPMVPLPPDVLPMPATSTLPVTVPPQDEETTPGGSGEYTAPIGEVPDVPVVPAPGPGPACTVTNCHGTEVTCGSSASGPVACDMMYQIGDFCRQYVSCQTIAGTCTPVKDPRHARCVSCVNECISTSDPMGAFDCESTCRAELEGVQ